MHRHTKQIVRKGLPLEQAKKVLIMTHGRGDTAEGILSLAEHLKVEGFALLAPQATANTWYPFSFMAPTVENEPGLSTALGVIGQLVAEVKAAGFSSQEMYLLGFSQGACLTSEFVARNAERYGGVFIFSGGVIGDRIDRSNYAGDFQETPIFLGCSDVDAHIPLNRVQDSTRIFQEMGATVTEEIYPNAPHTVFASEIEFANRVLAGK